MLSNSSNTINDLSDTTHEAIIEQITVNSIAEQSEEKKEEKQPWY